jgi:hypothetical protein
MNRRHIKHLTREVYCCQYFQRLNQA